MSTVLIPRLDVNQYQFLMIFKLAIGFNQKLTIPMSGVLMIGTMTITIIIVLFIIMIAATIMIVKMSITTQVMKSITIPVNKSIIILLAGQDVINPNPI